MRSEQEYSEFKKHFNLDLKEQSQTLDAKQLVLLIASLGGFIRLVAYSTELILFMRGQGALVGGVNIEGSTITIP